MKKQKGFIKYNISILGLYFTSSVEDGEEGFSSFKDRAREKTLEYSYTII